MLDICIFYVANLAVTSYSTQSIVEWRAKCELEAVSTARVHNKQTAIIVLLTGRQTL